VLLLGAKADESPTANKESVGQHALLRAAFVRVRVLPCGQGLELHVDPSFLAQQRVRKGTTILACLEQLDAPARHDARAVPERIPIRRVGEHEGRRDRTTHESGALAVAGLAAATAETAAVVNVRPAD
jgi:hypothetical protein